MICGRMLLNDKKTNSEETPKISDPSYGESESHLTEGPKENWDKFNKNSQCLFTAVSSKSRSWSRSYIQILA